MIKKLLKIFVKAIFPDNCLICNQIISLENVNQHSKLFCDKDFKKLSFITKPVCNICHYPLNLTSSNTIYKKIICGKCAQKKPKYDQAISVLAYNQASKALISSFKYFDQSHLAKNLANLMFESGKEIMKDIDFIAPVPLHKFRIIKRKYNQSAMLAKNIAQIADKKIILDLLVRTKNNKPQASLKGKARRSNVAGIFTAQKKYFNQIKDKNILLIDDVITTGATIEACCLELKKHQVKKTYLLTLAKTVKIL